jgi:hypothetical protein
MPLDRFAALAMTKEGSFAVIKEEGRGVTKKERMVCALG